jgi:hypothetical protein
MAISNRIDPLAITRIITNKQLLFKIAISRTNKQVLRKHVFSSFTKNKFTFVDKDQSGLSKFEIKMLLDLELKINMKIFVNSSESNCIIITHLKILSLEIPSSSYNLIILLPLSTDASVSKLNRESISVDT